MNTGKKYLLCFALCAVFLNPTYAVEPLVLIDGKAKYALGVDLSMHLEVLPDHLRELRRTHDINGIMLVSFRKLQPSDNDKPKDSS